MRRVTGILRSPVTLLFAGLALFLSGCPASDGDLSLDAAGVAALSVVNEDGPVTLTAGAADQIVVLWTGHSDEGPADPVSVDVSAEVSGTTAQVLAVTSGSDVWIDLDIDTPAALAWSVASGQGDVLVEDLSGGGSVDTSTGNVSGTGLSGDLAVDTEVAEVDLELAIAGGETIAVVVGLGPITVRLPSNADALLEASTGDGEVVITDVPFSGQNVGGVASGELGAGATATITLTTGEGDITIIASE